MIGGVRTILSPSVRIAVPARHLQAERYFAITTLSLCLLKKFRLIAATIASRMVFCWNRKPGLCPARPDTMYPHIIDDQTDLVILIVPAHNAHMIPRMQLIHEVSSLERLIILIDAEARAAAPLSTQNPPSMVV